MTSLSYIISALGEDAVRVEISSREELFFSKIEFLTDGVNQLNPDSLYLAPPSTYDGLSSELLNGITVMVSYENENAEKYVRVGGNLIVTVLPLFDLYNAVMRAMETIVYADNRFTVCFYEKGSLYSLILTAAELLNAHILLFDASFTVLSRTETFRPTDERLNMLFSKNRLSPREFDELLQVDSTRLSVGSCRLSDRLPDERQNAVYTFADANGSLLYLAAMMYKGKQRDIAGILRLCAGFVTKKGLKENQKVLNGFQQFLSTVLATSMGKNDIIQLFVSCGFQHSDDHRFFRLIIAEGGLTASRSAATLQNEISRFLKIECSCVYENAVVFLVAVTPENTFLLPNIGDICSVMERHGMHACISPAIPVFGVGVHYRLMKRALHLDCVMKYAQNKSCFYLEEYNVQLICDFCASHYADAFGSRNITPLIEHGIYMLHRYDIMNNNNLNETLYQYLLSGRNLALTANRMYMHKNTILYKLKKIRSMMLEDLDDPAVQTRLLFSYMLLKYYRDYCGGEFEIFDTDVSYGNPE